MQCFLHFVHFTNVEQTRQKGAGVVRSGGMHKRSLYWFGRPRFDESASAANRQRARSPIWARKNEGSCCQVRLAFVFQKGYLPACDELCALFVWSLGVFFSASFQGIYCTTLP